MTTGFVFGTAFHSAIVSPDPVNTPILVAMAGRLGAVIASSVHQRPDGESWMLPTCADAIY